MFDALVYLFENYFDAENQRYPDQDILSRKLSAAGFSNAEIGRALAWLRDLGDNTYAARLAESDAFRIYVDEEQRRIDADSRGFLLFLETAGILTPLLRERVIERVLALGEDEITPEIVKWTAMIVLWSEGLAAGRLDLGELLCWDASELAH